MKKISILTIFVFTLSLTAVSGWPKAPFMDPANDAEHLGPARNSLFWTPQQQVAGYRNVEKIFPTRVISAGGEINELPDRPKDLSSVLLAHPSGALTVDEYIDQQSVAGLLVIKDGAVVFER